MNIVRIYYAESCDLISALVTQGDWRYTKLIYLIVQIRSHSQQKYPETKRLLDRDKVFVQGWNHRDSRSENYLHQAVVKTQFRRF
jgi:hypothetical protein